MRGRVGQAALSVAMLALAGCGGGAGEGNGSTGVGSASGGGLLASAGGWDGTKACDVLKQADVAAVTGQPVGPGKLDGIMAASGGGAAVSTCYYDLPDGRNVSLLTRVSDGQDLAAAVASIKNPPAEYAMGTQADVPGVGKAALWNEQTKQLNFWLSGDQYGIITIMRGDLTKRPDLSTARDQAIALARRMGA